MYLAAASTQAINKESHQLERYEVDRSVCAFSLVNEHIDTLISLMTIMGFLDILLRQRDRTPIQIALVTPGGPSV
jgi:hypothetical protein